MLCKCLTRYFCEDIKDIIVSFLLQYEYEYKYLNNEWKIIDKKEVIDFAITNEHLDILKWALENNIKPSKISMSYAVDIGNLKIIKLLRKFDVPYDWRIAGDSAKYGHFEALKWMISDGCPINEYTCNMAVEGNQLKILKWLIKNGCKPNGSIAMHAGSIKMFNWLLKNGYD